jgi:hypothetical protein
MAKIFGWLLLQSGKTPPPIETILRTCRKNPGFRESLVRQCALGTAHPGRAALSGDEILAVLGIWLAQKPPDEVTSLVSLYAGEGWLECFDRDFFEKLPATAAAWRYQGLGEIATGLLKVGKSMADLTRNFDLAREFEREIIDRRQEMDGFPGH